MLTIACYVNGRKIEDDEDLSQIHYMNETIEKAIKEVNALIRKNIENEMKNNI